MRIAIISKSGTASDRRIVLRSGQVAQFGRTERTDVSFPNDAAMADVHFAIHCEIDFCLLQAMANDRETLVNGNPETRIHLKNGDSISAGLTQFVVEMDEIVAFETKLNSIQGATEFKAEDLHKTSDIATYIGLSEAAITLAIDWKDAGQFESKLVEASLLEDAIKWRAHTIPKPAGVLWARRCVDETTVSALPSRQKIAFGAAVQWANGPDEEKRTQCALIADEIGYEGLGGAIAAAAAWSGGSLGAPDQAPIPPDERLTGRCINTFFIILVSEVPQQDIPVRLRMFLDRSRSKS